MKTPREKKNNPKIDLKTKLEMGESSYSKTHVPFLCGDQGGHQDICYGSICSQAKPMATIDGSILQCA
jgi:hypothetical protein